MIRRSALFLAAALWAALPVRAADCRAVVAEFNARLSQPVEPAELTEALRSLASQGRLPAKFVTKSQARAAGWSPGHDLWDVPALQGRSIGGDRFGNREGRLPRGQWREADLDYHGGHRGGKRLVYAAEGRRFVSVDHYRTFHEVPPCQ